MKKRLKELRRVADRLITLGKQGDLHAKRLAYQRLGNHQLVKHLFDEIAPRFATRPGGYTRIYRLSHPRMGDCADMAYIELVERAIGVPSEEKKPKQKKEKEAPSLKERIKQGISAKASRLKQVEKSRAESEEKEAEDKNAQTHSRKIHRKTSRGT